MSNGNAIIVAGNLTHRRLGAKATSVPLRFMLPAGDGQPYVREIEVGEDGTPLDVGWVGTVALFVVQAEAAVEVGTPDGPRFLVPAGASLPFVPAGEAAWVLRSRGGVVRVILTVFPGVP